MSAIIQHSAPAPAGFFIAIEGGAGAGCTTQATLLCDQLELCGCAVVQIGLGASTLVGEALSSQQQRLGALARALLAATDLHDQIESRLLPALHRGAVVIADRYVQSLIAEQRCWPEPLVQAGIQTAPNEGYGDAAPAKGRLCVERQFQLQSWLDALVRPAPRPDLTVHLRPAPEHRADRILQREGTLSGGCTGRGGDWESAGYHGFIEHQRRFDRLLEGLAAFPFTATVEATSSPRAICGKIQSFLAPLLSPTPLPTPASHGGTFESAHEPRG